MQGDAQRVFARLSADTYLRQSRELLAAGKRYQAEAFEKVARVLEKRFGLLETERTKVIWDSEGEILSETSKPRPWAWHEQEQASILEAAIAHAAEHVRDPSCGCDLCDVVPA